jgi:hypothetical protein
MRYYGWLKVPHAEHMPTYLDSQNALSLFEIINIEKWKKQKNGIINHPYIFLLVNFF